MDATSSKEGTTAAVNWDWRMVGPRARVEAMISGWMQLLAPVLEERLGCRRAAKAVSLALLISVPSRSCVFEKEKKRRGVEFRAELVGTKAASEWAATAEHFWTTSGAVAGPRTNRQQLEPRCMV